MTSSQKTKTTSNAGRKNRKVFNTNITGYRMPENARLNRLPSKGPVSFSFQDVIDLARSIGTGDAFGIGKAAIKGGKEIAEYWTKPKSAPALIKAAISEEKTINRERARGVMTGTPHTRNLMRPVRQTKDRGYSKTFSGCDVLTSLVAPSGGCGINTIIYHVDINPATLGTRIKKFASSWEKYHLSGKFTLAPGSGTNVNGQVISYIDYDPSDVVPSGGGTQVMRTALAHDGAKVSALWEPNVQVIKRRNEPMEPLFIDNDESLERFVSCGHYYLVCSAPIAEGTAIGNLYLDWTLEVSIPQVDTGIPGGDYYVTRYTGAMGGTNAILGTYAGGAWSSGNTFQPVEVNKTTGVVTVGPGCYRIEVSISSATGLAFSGSAITVAKNAASKYTPGLDPGDTYEVITSTASVACVVAYCPGNFDIKLVGTNTAGTWTGLRYGLFCTTGSPVASSMAALNRLYKSAFSAAKQEENINHLKESIEYNEKKESDNYTMVYSTSASSTGSAGAIRKRF